MVHGTFCLHVGHPVPVHCTCTLYPVHVQVLVQGDQQGDGHEGKMANKNNVNAFMKTFSSLCLNFAFIAKLK